MRKLFLLAFIFSNAIFAQGLVGDGFNDQISDNTGIISIAPATKKNVNIEGTPYINDNFLPVKITSFEDKNFQARFNAYNGDMEVLDITSGTVYVLNKSIKNYNVTFIGTNTSYSVYQHIDEDGYVTNAFFITLTSNNGLTLIKKEKVQFLGERVATSTYDKARPAMYKRGNDRYYIKIGDTDAKPFSTKKKDIVREFSSNSKKILSFIKENKLKTSKEEDLIKVINFISSL